MGWGGGLGRLCLSTFEALYSGLVWTLVMTLRRTAPLIPDFFISHASEDKDEVARPLALELRKHGFNVWFDEFELRVGDSLTKKINAGLARSRFGVVVLSEACMS